MAIEKTIGSIGSPADYNSLFDALTYANTGLGDDVIFNVIDSGATVGGGRNISLTPGTTATIRCTFNETTADTSTWYTINTQNAIGNTLFKLLNNNTALVFSHLAFIVDGGAAGPSSIVGVGGNGNTQSLTVDHCIFAGNGASLVHQDGLYIFNDANATTKILSCKFQKLRNALYYQGAGSITIENCSLGGNAGYGITAAAVAATIKNATSVDNGSGDFHPNVTANATLSFNASDDATLSGIGLNNRSNITPADHFKSTSPPADVGGAAQISNDYLDLLTSADIGDWGTAPSFASSDLLGYTLPFSGTNPIGCHVRLRSTPSHTILLNSPIEGASGMSEHASILTNSWNYQIQFRDPYMFLPNNAQGLRALAFDGLSFAILDTAAGTFYDAALRSTYIIGCGANFINGYTFDGSAFAAAGTFAPGFAILSVADDGTYVYGTAGVNHLRAHSYDGTAFAYIANSASGGLYSKDVRVSDSYIFEGTQTGGLRAYTFNGVAFTYINNFLPAGGNDIAFVYPKSDSDIFVTVTNDVAYRVSFDGAAFALVATIASPDPGTLFASSLAAVGDILLIEWTNAANTTSYVYQYDISGSTPVFLNSMLIKRTGGATDEDLSYNGTYGFIGKSFSLYAFPAVLANAGGKEMDSEIEDEVSLNSRIDKIFM